MKIHFILKNIYGNTQYVDAENKISASTIGGKWYPTIDGELFDAGFVNINSMTDFVEKLDGCEEDLQMLGYTRYNNVFENTDDPRFQSEIKIVDDGEFEAKSILTTAKDKTIQRRFKTKDFQKLLDHIIQMYDFLNIDIFDSIIYTDPEKTQYVVESAMSSRDLAKNLVRVKSSNIWSYGINIKNRKDKTGDVLVQFKNPKGGAGDLYIYYDVPVSVWRKWLSATSKGSFLWRFIRNAYAYSKLTGDKRGKLANAINN